MNLTLNNYEKEHGKISFRNMLDIFKPQMILCNNIINIDEELALDLATYGITEEEYDREEYNEIYQYYIVDDTRIFEKLNYPVAYSNILNVYVVGITHWGASWKYILTDINIEEYKEHFE